MTSPQSRPVPVSTICARNGETFRIGALDVKALYTPGHTPADMSYMLEDAVFAGDTLFMPDYGTARCDFPGGDARTLYRSAARRSHGRSRPKAHRPARPTPWRDGHWLRISVEAGDPWNHLSRLVRNSPAVAVGLELLAASPVCAIAAANGGSRRKMHQFFRR